MRTNWMTRLIPFAAFGLLVCGCESTEPPPSPSPQPGVVAPVPSDTDAPPAATPSSDAPAIEGPAGSGE